MNNDELSPAPGVMQRQLHRGKARKVKVRCALCRLARTVRRKSFDGAGKVLEEQGWTTYRLNGWRCPACSVFEASVRGADW